MKNIAADNQKSPFFLTKFWFDTLARIVFPDRKRLDLECNNQKLPHIITSTKFLFLKLRTLRSLTNFYSPEFLPETAGDALENKGISSYYKSIEDTNRFDLIDLNPLSEKNADSVIAVLEGKNFFCEKYQSNTNWTHPDISSADEFWNLRSSKMKNILKSKKNKLFRDCECEVEISTKADESEVNKLLSDYHDVYNRSWKNNEPYTDFINCIAKEENTKGNLRIGILKCNGRAVAAQIWFIYNSTAYIFKLSYDNSLRSESVGSILMEAMFNHVIVEDKVTNIDFLTGDDKYKADWMTCSRGLFGVKAYNKKTIKGFICILCIKAKAAFKSAKDKQAPPKND
ncbi:GNAT family N-acetyltransferase [Rheinheimera sp.]|uniref:GNAT family N-acetyltransferase n=1 Tax=Rheinheimera sp. TaxID=1869214 RepID=UPI002FDCA215